MGNSTQNQWVLGLIGALVSAIVLVVGYIAFLLLSPNSEDLSIASAADVYTGITEIEPTRPMPDFTLTDQNGDSIQLSDLAGKPTLITFGFTNCPDICPLTLNEYRQIHQDMAAQADNINFVFISVDGARDTPAVLRRYFTIYGTEGFMVGMTGSEDAVRTLGQDYGLEFIYREPNETGWYNVDHTAGSFLLDADGNWIRRYAYATDRNLIVDDLRTILG